MSDSAIPESFIKSYVDQLLWAAERLEPGRMRDAVLLRADIVMDLVKAWRGKNTRTRLPGEAAPRVKRLACPHGDKTCPCQDGDTCHYEGHNPMTPPGEAAQDEEWVPHLFAPDVNRAVDHDGPIWCAQCAYHRDSKIHAVPGEAAQETQK